MSLIGKNPEFGALHHHYYTTRNVNPLKKMQSLMVVAAKLSRVFYAMRKLDAIEGWGYTRSCRTEMKTFYFVYPATTISVHDTSKYS